MQESRLTESISLICTSVIWGSILCFHILSFLGAHHREWLQFDGCYMADILSFLISLGPHQLTIHGGCSCMTVTSLFYSYNRKYSISHIFMGPLYV